MSAPVSSSAVLEPASRAQPSLRLRCCLPHPAQPWLWDPPQRRHGSLEATWPSLRRTSAPGANCHGPHQLFAQFLYVGGSERLRWAGLRGVLPGTDWPGGPKGRGQEQGHSPSAPVAYLLYLQHLRADSSGPRHGALPGVAVPELRRQRGPGGGGLRRAAAGVLVLRMERNTPWQMGRRARQRM